MTSAERKSVIRSSNRELNPSLYDISFQGCFILETLVIKKLDKQLTELLREKQPKLNWKITN
jgi:hypothetical protein